MKRLALALALIAVTRETRARADAAPVEAHADDVTLDARARELELRGNVRVDSPPFHLRSEALHLRRSALGVEVDGTGHLAFCPCLGTPLAIRFEGAIVAPPGDLVLRSPRLEIYRVPVMWLPYFWLRSPARAGILPPEIAYRGRDGMFLGGGVHLPWRSGDGEHGLEVRGGGYFRGGLAVGMDLRTPSSVTVLRYDRLDGDGLLASARGVLEETPRRSTAAWDVDVLRGARGVLATSELDAAARVHDRAQGSAALRDGGWTVAAGARSTAARGSDFGDFGAAQPTLSLARAEALGRAGTYDVALGGAVVRRETGTVSYARGEGGLLLASHVGPVGTRVSGRLAGDVASDGLRSGRDGAATVQATAALPLARSFAASDPADPWRHRLEPRVRGGALTTEGDRLLGVFPGRALDVARGSAWVADAGVATALGRWGKRDGFEVEGTVGAVGGMSDGISSQAVARWRLGVALRLLAAGGEGAHVLRPGAVPGGALIGRVRLGALDAPHVRVGIAGRGGVDPLAARLLTDAPLEPSGGFLSASGWSGGAQAFIPWTRRLATRAGVDGDLTERVLLGARGSLELRDKCECVALRLAAAHRLGRDGVDVWLTLDVAPRSNAPR